MNQRNRELNSNTETLDVKCIIHESDIVNNLNDAPQRTENQLDISNINTSNDTFSSLHFDNYFNVQVLLRKVFQHSNQYFSKKIKTHFASRLEI
uniref:Uncharacterized protein n=1 Tax=Strongyloides stercoralis TaxID=6248 RepID=A0A0K0DZS6_STRER